MPHRFAAALTVAVVLLVPYAWTVRAANVAVAMEMRPSGALRFGPDHLQVGVGDNVTFVVYNNDSIVHTFDIDELDVHSPQMASGANWTVTFQANQQGTFEFYCDIPGHRSSGMVGTLQVGAAPPPTDNAMLIAALGILVIVVILIVAVVAARRGKKDGDKPS